MQIGRLAIAALMLAAGSISGCTTAPVTPGTSDARRPPVRAKQLTQTVHITGNVLAPAGPKARMTMTLDPAVPGRLHASWSWSTTTVDYGSDTVPANYIVGLFVWNASETKWTAFKVDSGGSPAARWSERIGRFHDTHPAGGIDEVVPGTFTRGTWCMRLAAASTASTGGVFIAAPASTESCVTVP